MFKRRNKSNVIEFIIENEILLDVIPKPVRAGALLPDWFKKLPPEFTDEIPFVLTIKKCAPFVDALSAGYLLKTPQRFDFKHVEGGAPSIGWNDGVKFSNGPSIQTHTGKQIEGSGWGGNVLKIMNPWIIKTPPGVSCLFVPPLNRDDLPFEVISGIVDTDTYNHTINFPFRPTKEYTGVINGGTPYVQVIPFRRTKLKHVIRVATPEELENREKAVGLTSIYDSAYRKLMRHK